MKKRITILLLLTVFGLSGLLKAQWLVNNPDWLGASDITNATNLLDNNLNAYGYLSMSYYSTLYTKYALITFPETKTISKFKFKYAFPATVQSPCHGFPDPIAHTCKGKLYYKQGGVWYEAYTVTDNLNTTADPSICEVVDSVEFIFDSAITAQEWKFEMIGGYWLGAQYQSTTYFKVFELGFYEEQTTSNDIVGYYPFNGNANDESGNGNDGTVNGATLTTDRFGNTNSAYSYDGINDYISLGNQLNPGYDDYSISVWVNTNGSSESQTIISKRYDYGNPICWPYAFAIHPDTSIHFYIRRGDESINLIAHGYEMDTWAHFVIIRDGGTSRFYKNGVLFASDTNINLINANLTNSQVTNIGRNPTGIGEKLFSGFIDDISIFNKTLTQQEIDSLYHIGGWDLIEPEFIAAPLSGRAPLDVQFTDQSTGNPISWQWDFENDDIYDSFEQNPSFTYEAAGEYSVKLLVGDEFGYTDSIVKESYILVDPPLVADFSFVPTTGTVGIPVQFTDQSTGGGIASWEWDFQNDGTIDSYENITDFTYTQDGTYDVKLTISDGTYFDSTIKQIEVYYANEPVISSILDVPNDEGRQVVINWYKSTWDDGNNPYRIWRLQNWADDPWEFMGEVPSQSFDEYAYIAPTISDSNAQGIPYFTYIVSFNNQAQGTFNSEPDSGYSVDNLAPTAPQNLMGQTENTSFNLYWDQSEVRDFDFYTVYQNDEQGNPSLVLTNVDNTATIPLLENSLETFVTATDYNGNESAYSNQLLVPFYKELIIPQGWSGLSYPVIPENPQLEYMMAPVNSMVIMQNMDGVYWPEMAVNSIGDFNAHDGYAIKMNIEQTLSLIGYDETNKTITLPIGWSILPVISKEPVPASEIFGQMGSHLEIVKDIAGYRIYWPEMGIFQIEVLEPGTAYYVKLSESVTISY